MPNIKPISDLRNYSEVLHDVAVGSNPTLSAILSFILPSTIRSDTQEAEGAPLLRE